MLGATTDAEMAVAPSPASTAARTASFDGSSIAICNRLGSIPRACIACSKTDRVPDPFSRSTHALSIRRAGRWRLAFSPSMFGADDDHQLIARDRRTDQMLAFDHGFDEAEFNDALFDGFSHLRRIADGHLDIDPRIGAAKGNEMARQPIARNGLTRLDRQRAAVELAKLAQHKLGAFGLRKDRSRFNEKGAARFRQFDAAADTIEKLRVVARFERRDGMARRRLRKVERLRGLGHMLALGNRHKDAKLLQGHLSSILSFQSRYKIIYYKNIYLKDQLEAHRFCAD